MSCVQTVKMREKKIKVEIAVILDRSGSMNSIQTDVIGSFNSNAGRPDDRLNTPEPAGLHIPKENLE